MKPKRYRVEIQSRDSTIWEIVHYTDSLPVAKRHAAATVKSQKIQAARVMNQNTGQLMVYEQG